MLVVYVLLGSIYGLWYPLSCQADYSCQLYFSGGEPEKTDVSFANRYVTLTIILLKVSSGYGRAVSRDQTYVLLNPFILMNFPKHIDTKSMG